MNPPPPPAASPFQLPWRAVVRAAVRLAAVAVVVLGGIRLVLSYAELSRKPPAAPLPEAPAVSWADVLGAGHWEVAADGLSVTFAKLSAAEAAQRLDDPVVAPSRLPPLTAAETEILATIPRPAGGAGEFRWGTPESRGRAVSSPDGKRLVRLQVASRADDGAYLVLEVAPGGAIDGPAADALLPVACGVLTARRWVGGALAGELFAVAPPPDDLDKALRARGWSAAPGPLPVGATVWERGPERRLAWRIPADGPAACLLVSALHPHPHGTNR